MSKSLRCLFCGNMVGVPDEDLFVTTSCSCGAYCQTDQESYNSMFPGDAAEALGIKRSASDQREFFSQIECLKGECVGIAGGEKVMAFWARRKVAAANAV